MKKHFAILLASVLLLGSCAKVFRDELTELHEQMSEILAMVDQANSNLEAVQILLSVLKDYDYITDISPILEDGVETGYQISFTSGKVATIYHGEAGHAPVMGVQKDEDGFWYWTVDGEWLRNEKGDKVRADGKVPLLKIENDRWLISYDEGETWRDLGGSRGDSMFEEIIVTEGDVLFVMTDGNVFAIPKNPRVRIILDIPDTETGVLPGSEIQINYTLENATDSTFVTASSNGYYGVRVEVFDEAHGRVIVTSPYKYADGYINIMVSDGASYSFIKVVNFYEHKMEFPNGLEYYVSPHGGEVYVPFSTNFEYRFEVEDSSKDWLTIEYGETKSEMRDGFLKITADMNDYESARMGKVRVIPTNSTGDMYTEVIINQSSAYFSIDQSKYAVPVEGATIVTNIRSSRGLSLSVPSNASGWLQSSIESLGGDDYRVTTVISENETTERRAASVGMYSTDRRIHLGTLEFVQACPMEEDISNMVFEVRANFSNDFTAHLPIAGKYDCYIDWGDGQAEYVIGGEEWWEGENAGISHKYNVEEPSTFIVRISGTVTSLDSEGVKAPCISEVIQWGKTDLRYISGAFRDNYLLKRVCSDPYNALGNIDNLDQVFYRCSELEEIPEDVFKNCVNVYNANQTFSGCRSLKAIPEKIFASCRNLGYLHRTFGDCSALTEIPEKLFAGNPVIYSMNSVFENCDGITSIPEDLFSSNPDIETMSWTFHDCDYLETIPNDLFAANTKVKDFTYTFNNCDRLKVLPEGLFRNNKDATQFDGTFQNCHALTIVPVNIFDNNRKVINFQYTFGWCYEMQGESPYTVIDGVKYHLYERHLNPDHFVKPIEYYHCFAECRYLTDFAEMEPSPWFNNWQ